MTHTVAAENAGRAGEKEKVEKRRALGRGLESLLPGPRVVAGTAARAGAPPAAGVSGDAGARAGVPAPPVPGPHLPAGGTAFEGTIQALADDGIYEAARAGVPVPHAPVPPLPGPADEPITIYAQAESRMPANLVVNLAIADIDKNPFQTRYVEDDEKLEELADSIKANGVVQPIMVRPGDEEGRYILVLGERRLHASKKAGKTHIPALVRRVSLQQAAEMTIIENLQREDLSALEQAEAFRVLSNEFHLTQQQIGERVGLSRASVTNYMRLLKLPREVMQLLAEKKINFAQARELLKLDSDDKIAEAALYAVKKGMTVEQVEMLVLRMTGLLDPIPGMPGQEPKKSGARWVDPNVRAAQLDLERMLGVRVRIRDRKGKGKIVIEYSTVDDYERVVEMLRGKK
ncbi:MAG: ParB/RepB/Spo0J family partition protein [Candidatus Sulfotelmatobacter sp.]